MGTSVKYIEVLKRNRAEYPKDIRWKVVVEEHYKCFVCEDGSCYALEKDGNICGLCKKKDSHISGSELLKKAIESGGTKLQAFGKRLYEFYTQNGFRPITWIKFDWRYAPKGCTHSEPLIFYTLGKSNKTFDKFISKTKPEKTMKEAYKRRDKCQQEDRQI